MAFRNPLLGGYSQVNTAFLREKADRRKDPRHVFYVAILSSTAYEQYYEKVGDCIVQPETTTYLVNADMEIRYAKRRGWIE